MPPVGEQVLFCLMRTTRSFQQFIRLKAENGKLFAFSTWWMAVFRQIWPPALPQKLRKNDAYCMSG